MIESLYHGAFILSFVATAFAVLFYALAIIPNLKSGGGAESKKKNYPVYYGDIGHLKLEVYQKLMKDGTDKDFADELVLETWHNSSICTSKDEAIQKWCNCFYC